MAQKGKNISMLRLWTCVAAILLFYSNCKNEDKGNYLFEVLDSKRTGLDFENRLSYTPQFNLFKYMYFYNGSGVGAGDFNNDGLIDLFFSANQVQNRLYINSGDLKFKDITSQANIPNDGAWSTGVSVIDINNDGMLDIYVCRVGNYEILKGHNQLLVCDGIKDGIPRYTDRAKEYGLDFSGFSTQAAFLDYDMDGDLDMYLLNHSIRYNATFSPRSSFKGTYGDVSGDRLYRNDGAKFSDVTKESGINSTIIGYGLGIAVSDINLDGYPDIYIGNDFHENDYLYINQKNGTFKDELTERMMHTSQFSMGVDVADINNDAYPEIVSLDMLPSDPYILKKSEGEDAYETFKYKLGFGYNHQYARNNLQLNNKNGMFTETGLYSGIYATDWSWAALWMDFDNDGLKDLFVANGIPKRMNDIDYINFVSDEAVQLKIRTNSMKEKDMELIEKFPKIKIPNNLFRNQSNLSFSNIESQIRNDKPTYSNGAVYADFDNDGDLDIVVNNIDDPVTFYENITSNETDSTFVEIKLKGSDKNINAIGAKIVLFERSGIRTYEKFASKGFQSSMESPLLIGLKNSKVDSAFLIWPDNSYQSISNLFDSSRLSIAYRAGLPVFNYGSLNTPVDTSMSEARNVTKESGVEYLHQENTFNEFNREALIPHMISTEGPALATGDINNDGLQDLFIGSSRGKKSAVFVQNKSGRFNRLSQPNLGIDSTYEDVGATWTDVNGDGNVDLVIASGGNEYYGKDAFLLPRVYLNNGQGSLTKKSDAFENIYVTASCVSPVDFNKDGKMDLFIGGRAVPYAYGEVPRSYLLQNDGTGKFRDVTSTVAKELEYAGFVTSAIWNDIDKDNDEDLILSTEWGGVAAYINNAGTFNRRMITEQKGWWNFVLPCDFDNDGDIDIMAGNLGLNSRLNVSSKPIKMYVYDFDGNGRKEQVVTYWLTDREIPFANKMELEKQMPVMKKRFLYADDFARASLDDLFSREKLNKAIVHEAGYFSNAILINDGKMNFELRALPWQAQLTPYRDAVIMDANNDRLPDVFLAGNYYESNIQMGRYDGSYGALLINKGSGNFEFQHLKGFQVKGQVRHIAKVQAGEKELFVLARNNDSTVVLNFGRKKRE